MHALAGKAGAGSVAAGGARPLSVLIFSLGYRVPCLNRCSRPLAHLLYASDAHVAAIAGHAAEDPEKKAANAGPRLQNHNVLLLSS